jgi:hypothetical protein
MVNDKNKVGICKLGNCQSWTLYFLNKPYPLGTTQVRYRLLYFAAVTILLVAEK